MAGRRPLGGSPRLGDAADPTGAMFRITLTAAALTPGPQPSGAPSQHGTMCPQESHRWCEVSHRIGAPQLSHGASPPMVGWQAAGVRVWGCASLTKSP